MGLYFFIPLLSALGVIIIQDLKYRAVSWIFFPLVFCLLIIQGYLKHNFNIYILDIGLSIGFLVIQLFIVQLYFFVKTRKFSFIVNNLIGLGDVLFFVAIIPAFSFENFLAFYLLGLIICLALALPFYFKNKNFKFPLAGCFAVLLIIVLMFAQFNIFDMYNDSIFSLIFR